MPQVPRGKGLAPLPRRQAAWWAATTGLALFTARRVPRHAAPQPLVGMEYETWFACQAAPGAPTVEAVRQKAARQVLALHPPQPSLNAPDLALQLAELQSLEECTWINGWHGREATPLLGTYRSSDPRVLDQHLAWLESAGIDFLLVDWSNNLGGNWQSGTALGIMAATYNLFEALVRRRSPLRLALLLGLDAGQVGTAPFLQQVDLVDQLVLRVPAFRAHYLEFHGRPLLPVYTGPTSNPPPAWDDPRFTVRWVNAFAETTHANQFGCWSWLDRSPQVTYRFTASGQAVAEAVTVAAGYPGSGAPASWLAPDAGPRRHGATYLAQWAVAFEARPEVVLLCQWNEFAQPDQYDPEHSNDMEPTAPHGYGVHGPGGWGTYYLDLTRTMVAAFHAGRPQPRVRLDPRVP